MATSGKASKDKHELTIEVNYTHKDYIEGSVRAYTTPLNQDPDMYYGRKYLWSACISTEESCCGFSVLSDFGTNKVDKGIAKQIGEKMKEVWTKEKAQYIAAYVPDQKRYDSVRLILVTAGFKPQAQVKSIHGKYTNTRWEWFGPTYKEPKHETAVPTYNV